MKSAPTTKSSESAKSHGHYIKNPDQRLALSLLLRGPIRCKALYAEIGNEARAKAAIQALRTRRLDITTEIVEYQTEDGRTHRYGIYSLADDHAVEDAAMLVGAPPYAIEQVAPRRSAPAGNKLRELPVYTRTFPIGRYRLTYSCRVAHGAIATPKKWWSPDNPPKKVLQQNIDIIEATRKQFMRDLLKEAARVGLVGYERICWWRES